jgi:HlyD family secretion protein
MKRRVIVLTIIIVLLIAGGAYVFQIVSKPPPSTANVQTTTVRRGSLAATVGAAGNIAVSRTTSLSPQTSGRVTQVNIKVSDRVKAGQTLVQLDLTDLMMSLKSAQLSLASAQANFDNAKVKNAQNANQLIIAKASLERARLAVQAAQSDYDTVAWRAGSASTSQATALQQATIDYQSALASYNTTVSTINDTDLRNSQIALDQAKLNVEQAQLNLDRAKIVAPFDGIVTSVSLNVGDNASSGAAAVVMIDPSRLQISVTVSEVDIARVKLGQTAQVTIDALPGKSYSAQVTTINPTATVTQGVVNYPVILVLSNADDAIKPGMTANLIMEVERRDNVLLLPTRAVRTQGNQRLVTVLYKEQSMQIPVTTGLSNDQSIEITSGLQEGDVVVINPTNIRPGNVPGGAIPFFGR